VSEKFSIDAPIAAEVDVLVCGGGPAGIGAALAAARQGSSTMLIEQQGYLGGVATGALIGTWFGSYSRDGEFQVIKGVFQEIVDRLVADGVAKPATNDLDGGSAHSGYAPWHRGTVPFEFEAAKRLFDRMMLEAGVKLRYFTSVMYPKVENGRITGVFVFSKNGVEFIKARVVVDATGDADVTCRAGCPMLIGLEEEGHTGWMSPGALAYVIEEVDAKAFGDYCKAGDFRFRELIGKLREQGEWPYEDNIFIAFEMPDPKRYYVKVNPTIHKEGLDGTDTDALTSAIIEGRRIVFEQLEILRKHFPGFANARLTQTAPVVGVRVTRRIFGEYKVTVDDVRSGLHFDDTIALTGYHWDMQTPGSVEQRMLHKVEVKLQYAAIPYRSIIPQGIDNLIAPGRAISADWDVLGPYRIMPAVIAMGQAAGVSAATAAESGVAMRDIDVTVLRDTLRTQNAIVDGPA
jgi:2-polyprenyl-6-methoxyphenol hydroxylase-like FAD-dependent oxidoreductase